MKLMSHFSHFLLQSLPMETRTYALIVLNQQLPRVTPLLWKHAQLRLCADGGANRIYDEMPQFLSQEDPLEVRSRYTPDVINGDMDSIRMEVQEFYSKLGTKVLDESQDQDTTDLHKCVNYILDCSPNLEKSNLSILVAGALGGRFDHEIGNINVLFRFSNIRIILLSDDCLIYLLPKTHHHEIHIQSSVEGPHCGLIPIGSPSASTTTTGLQWDLRTSWVDTGASHITNNSNHLDASFPYSAKSEMRFGGLISTSNLVREDKVTVQSDSDLLWTISIRKPI